MFAGSCLATSSTNQKMQSFEKYLRKITMKIEILTYMYQVTDHTKCADQRKNKSKRRSYSRVLSSPSSLKIDNKVHELTVHMYITLIQESYHTMKTK